MRSSLVVRATDCQCTSCKGPGIDPSIRRHSGIWGAADEAVLNIVGNNGKTIFWVQNFRKNRSEILVFSSWPKNPVVFPKSSTNSNDEPKTTSLSNFCYLQSLYYVQQRRAIASPRPLASASICYRTRSRIHRSCTGVKPSLKLG